MTLSEKESAGFSAIVVSVQRSFLFLRVLEKGYVILLWHSLGFPYNYFGKKVKKLVRIKVEGRFHDCNNITPWTSLHSVLDRNNSICFIMFI